MPCSRQSGCPRSPSEEPLNEPDELEKGFQLAYFLMPDRYVATQILTGALNKLRVQRGHESKRAYWRDKYLKRSISKISRGDQDTLQWLIEFESEGYERRQEQASGPTEEDMVVRYVKSLVQITTAMSSFHVNIGLRRLLHHYSTAEAQQFYELITDRFLGADEYRRAKGLLMARLDSRFGRYLKSTRTQHGEVRFEVFPDQSRWTGFVHNCLTMLIPWSTHGRCLASPDVHNVSGILPNLLSGDQTSQEAPHDLDQVELSRCHAFIHPACLGRLSNALGLDPPEQRLAVPRFYLDGSDGEDQSENSRQTSPLTEEERKKIANDLSARATRGDRCKPEFLRVIVDGVERARLDLNRVDERQFEIEEGAKLVEVRSQEGEDDFLIATYLIPYKEWTGIAASAVAIPLGGAGELLLHVSPISETSDELRRATVSVKFQPRAGLAAWGTLASLLWRRLRPATALITIVFLFIGWTLSVASYRRELHSQQSVLEQVQKELEVGKAAHASLRKNNPLQPFAAAGSYRLIPDDRIVRGARDGATMPAVSIPAEPVIVNLELPLNGENHTLYQAVLKPFLGKKQIMSETLLSRLQPNADSTITFSLPSCLVEQDRDYTIEVSYITSAGRLEELYSFSFHVDRKNN